MIRHRTFTSLWLAAAAGAVLAVLLGLLTPGPAHPPIPEAPRSLRLPSGRVVPVQAISTGRDGQLDVPDDPRTAGWWRGSSRVGDRSGKTFLAAHIDSPRQRLGPFAELYDAQPGLPLVLRSAGLRQDFHVRSVRLVRRESLTARPDLYSPSGTRRARPRHLRATVRSDARGLPEPRRARGRAQRSADSSPHPRIVRDVSQVTRPVWGADRLGLSALGGHVMITPAVPGAMTDVRVRRASGRCGGGRG